MDFDHRDLQEALLEYNPYTVEYDALLDSYGKASVEKDQWDSLINWFEQFDSEKLFTELSSKKREYDSLLQEIDSLSAKMEAASHSIDALKEKSRFGYNPRHWFSDERTSASRERDEAVRHLSSLNARGRLIVNRISALGQEIDSAQSELEKYRRFDHLEAEAAVRAFGDRLNRLQGMINSILLRKDKVDQLLREPLAELHSLKVRKSTLDQDIAVALSMDRELTAASNSYERRMIHERCETRFRESKPGKVLGAKRRELESVERNIEKLDVRLKKIVQRATRKITMLVLDGNNLCYSQQDFIGLAPLKTLSKSLSIDYEVFIVFDASIRRRLQMNDAQITAQFSRTAKVHVVATKQSADETLLNAAASSTSYVISNDRFLDFPEMPAVREQRLIRHEILNGMIYVHDLSVAEDFTVTV